ncbi:MAG: hypothetical protein FWD82_07600 [Defluviitaleaceae bacterium]|nr:hypothetical protein [Defluviitaleaceae bacterium]
MDWQKELDVFLADFKYKNDVSGILVCGSFITGNPSKRSDLDVHIVLNESVLYKERGNKIVNGLLIEYFANPSREILKYFKWDIEDKSLMAQTQFATGEILLDKNGDIKHLKDIALKEIEEFYQDQEPAMSELAKYHLWDMADDLADAFENNKPEFDFLYFNFLNNLISSYMSTIKMPYNFKTILGNVNSDIVRKKYLLKELPDVEIKNLIEKCIITTEKEEKVELFQILTNKILNKFGGFEIDGFAFKTNL